MLAEPALDPPESFIIVGRKGIDGIVVTDTEWVQVFRGGHIYLIPMSNIRHVRL